VAGLLVDSSVWVAVAFRRHPHHVIAQDELERATQDQPAMFCRATQQSFLRLVSTPQISRAYQSQPVTNRAAWSAYETLLARSTVAFLDEPRGTVALWHRLATLDTSSPKVWMDAYLAAFAMKGGLEFVTLDRDFRIYEPHGIRLRLLMK